MDVVDAENQSLPFGLWIQFIGQHSTNNFVEAFCDRETVKTIDFNVNLVPSQFRDNIAC